MQLNYPAAMCREARSADPKHRLNVNLNVLDPEGDDKEHNLWISITRRVILNSSSPSKTSIKDRLSLGCKIVWVRLREGIPSENNLSLIEFGH